MTRLTVVVDNRANPGLTAEYGLALWLEHDGRRLLLDTGAGAALGPNLAALGLDPASLDAVALSHGHLDHTGGLPWLLEARGGPTDVWCHCDVFASHLVRRQQGLVDIGPPLGQAGLEALGARFHFVSGLATPWPGLSILTDIPRLVAFEGPGPNLLAMIDGQLRDDPFHDDLALLVQTSTGPAAISGCAHAGPLNILAAAHQALGQAPAWFIGGTHLGPVDHHRRQRTAQALAAMDGLRVISGHCTLDAEDDLRQTLGARYTAMAAGLVVEF